MFSAIIRGIAITEQEFLLESLSDQAVGTKVAKTQDPCFIELRHIEGAGLEALAAAVASRRVHCEH